MTQETRWDPGECADPVSARSGAVGAWALLIGHALTGLAGDRRGAARLAALQERLTGPVRMVVCGRAGNGRRTLSSALVCGGLDAPVAEVGTAAYAEAEVRIVVIGAACRLADRAFVHDAFVHDGAASVVVVAGHADARTPQEAQRLAAAAGGALGVPVMPISALWAIAEFDAHDVALLAKAARDDRGSVDAAARDLLLGRLDLPGWRFVLEAVRAGTTDPAALTALIRARSGIHDLCRTLAAAVAEATARRPDRLRRELSVIAAASASSRDRIEEVLLC